MNSVSLELETTEATIGNRTFPGDSGRRCHLRPWTAVLSQFLFCAIACAGQAVNHAKDAPSCKGPPALEADILRHPSAAAYDALGAFFGVHKELTCAIREFRTAVHLDPEFPEARYDLGLTLFEFGGVKEAVEELEVASRLNPSLAHTHTALALALDKQGEPDAAIQEFERSLRIDPISVAALDGIAKSLIAEKRYLEAINYLKNAPKDESLELDLASAYSAAGDTNAALQTLLSLVEARPGSNPAHLNLGFVYEQQKRYRNAV